MPRLFLPPIKILRVGLLPSLHEFGQRRRRALKQKMDVVRHQTKSVNRVTILLAVLRQSFEIRPIVILRGKTLLPLIAPNDHVIEETGNE